MVSWPQEQNPRVCLVPVLGSIHPSIHPSVQSAWKAQRSWLEDLSKGYCWESPWRGRSLEFEWWKTFKDWKIDFSDYGGMLVGWCTILTGAPNYLARATGATGATESVPLNRSAGHWGATGFWCIYKAQNIPIILDFNGIISDFSGISFQHSLTQRPFHLSMVCISNDSQNFFWLS